MTIISVIHGLHILHYSRSAATNATLETLTISSLFGIIPGLTYQNNMLKASCLVSDDVLRAGSKIVLLKIRLILQAGSLDRGVTAKAQAIK